MTYPERWQLKPENEERLEGKVPRQIVQHDTERDAFQKVEEAKDDPVREPLGVVLMTGRLESPEREVSGDSPSDEI